MFTGSIQSIAKIKKVERQNSSLVFTIATPKGWKLKSGDSIATDGACLTVKKVGNGWYQTELMAETLRRTTFGRLVPNKVNLERPLRPSDFIDGHIVQGHVDTVGVIRNKEPHTRAFGTVRGRQGTRDKATTLSIQFPKEFGKFILEKGSIAVDGVSLTIVDAGKSWFSLALIPYTLEHTTIGDKKVHDFVNLEFDILAKYILRKQ